MPTTVPARHKRGCLFFLIRGLIGFAVMIIVLIVIGTVYQAIGVELDKRNYAPRGQLYTVNGRQMHINCVGEGSPTVILQAGGGAESLWWYWVQNQLAAHTRVCAYDRSGYGWSDPTENPREALTIVEELHLLLEEAGIDAPYVMAGHSYGAVFTRIYAAQYPQDVIGIVLIDSAVLIPEQFTDQAAFDQWRTQWTGAHTLFQMATSIGLTRLVDPSQFQAAGYPAEIAFELTALHARNQVIDTDVGEFVTGYWSLVNAASDAENLGDLPMIVLWASETIAAFDTNIVGFAAAREEISVYSSNSITRYVEGATHSSILGNEQYAQQITNAILDVIRAVPSGESLTP